MEWTNYETTISRSILHLDIFFLEVNKYIKNLNICKNEKQKKILVKTYLPFFRIKNSFSFEIAK